MLEERSCSVARVGKKAKPRRKTERKEQVVAAQLIELHPSCSDPVPSLLLWLAW